jgi:GNAT superfamily N-acetyltransferase
MTSAQRYSMRLATAADLGALAGIERAAAEMFRSTAHPEMADADLACEHLRETDVVWVAVDAQQQPVGFAIVRRAASTLHLQEIDVHPAHARQGLGARLIATIARWAEARGLRALTLSTCDDVPWNGPYYARLGFRQLAAAELTAELQQVRQAEAAARLPMEHRICMQLTLGSSIDPSLPKR